MGITPESDSIGLGMGPGHLHSNQSPAVNQIQEDRGPHFTDSGSMTHKGLFKILNIKGIRAPQSGKRKIKEEMGEESAAPKLRKDLV